MNLGIIAHNSKKVLIEDFCIAYKNILAKHEVYATGTTGRRIEEATNLHVHKFLAGSIGGDKQFMEMVERQDLDMVILFYNPVMMDPKEPDIQAIVMRCDQYNIPVATNIATAELLILGLARGDLDWRLDSSALMADAWHHRSDAFSSIGALIGIAGARLGFPIMDSIASLIIFVFIIKAAYDIFKDAIDKMVDHACDDDTVNQIRECVMKHEDVLGIDMLQTRIFGNKIYVDLEIATDGSYTLSKAHTIAESVHDDIEKSFPKVKHIMVHVNPADV